MRAICQKARTNKKGKISKNCQRDNCPLGGPREYSLTYDTSLKTCEIVASLNKEIEVEENGQRIQQFRRNTKVL